MSDDHVNEMHRPDYRGWINAVRTANARIAELEAEVEQSTALYAEQRKHIGELQDENARLHQIEAKRGCYQLPINEEAGTYEMHKCLSPFGCWTCFHCGERFSSGQMEEARLHFGAASSDVTICKIVDRAGGAAEAIRHTQAEVEAEANKNTRLSALLTQAEEALEGYSQLRSSIQTWALHNRIPGWQTEDDLFAKAQAALTAIRENGHG